MLTLQPIRTSSPHWNFVESLLVTSFPLEEYRELAQWRAYTDTNERFHNQVILDGDIPVGLISYWYFDTFCYVEHFAIAPNQRNGGYGKSVLQQLFAQLPLLPVVLEVELPVGELETRRIGFYERQAFTLWDFPYQQPPYRPGGEYLPMRLMVHGNLPTDAYETVRDTLYHEVYGI